MPDKKMYAYGEEFEAKVVEWLKEEGLEAVRSGKLYGEASESQEAAVFNKRHGDVLVIGRPLELECKRNYFVAKNYDKSHPFSGWMVLTNNDMEKSKTIVVHSGSIKSWINKRRNNPNAKWDKSSLGHEGIYFDPEVRPLKKSKSWDEFVKEIESGSKTL